MQGAPDSARHPRHLTYKRDSGVQSKAAQLVAAKQPLRCWSQKVPPGVS